MTICLSDAGKRFNRDWIFRHFSYQFTAGQAYAITGPNGSGKSTLLQAISGAMLLSEGKIEFKTSAGDKNADDIYRDVSICAPYLEVIEEMTALEFLNFHGRFKPFLSAIGTQEIVNKVGLEKAAGKQIRYFSSGMKQRIKLAQCIFSDTPIVLLDEPCTNLDSTGIELYHSLVRDYCSQRLIVVSSNDEVEYSFCKERILVSEFK